MSDDALRDLFVSSAVPPAELVGKLPRITCGKCRDAPGKCCADHQRRTCNVCGNYITEKHLHLDYFGHAEVTRVLLAADPLWSWEPVAFAEDGSPLITQNGRTAELWIRLTVHGHARLGVGTCDASKPEVAKELVGDALRNAAMRFGVALSLWSKEEWSDLGHDDTPTVTVTRDQANRRVLHHLAENGWSKEEAVPKAAALMSSIRGDGPFPESDLADLFARAAAEVKV